MQIAEFAEHQKLHDRIDEILADPAVDGEDRIRMMLAFGAVGGIDDVGGGLLGSVPGDELRGQVKDVVRELLRI